MTPALFQTFARYNTWQNTSLMAAANRLDDAARKQDRGAFFGSIHRTFNHILLGDRVWMGRFQGPVERFASLSEEIHTNWDAFMEDRRALDARIEAFTLTLTEAALSTSIRYQRMSEPSREVTQVLAFALLHFFNHQTHHRGQITALLMQTGIDPGVTDLIALPGGAALT